MVGIFPDVAKRDFVKIQLTPAAKAKFEALYDAKGMSQIKAATRLVEWLLDQDEVVQDAVLGTLPKSIRVDVARLVLERMGAGDASRELDPIEVTEKDSAPSRKGRRAG